MAFPPEFQRYKNEADFIQRFLVPLLQRLGFSLVVNYHGTAELGKDLIFGEIDRFGHIRYHGLQAKYEPSISLNEVEGLIADCKQAFENPFTHPQRGGEERISSFYAVNGGSLGDRAVEHYFNSLQQFGANVRLLQGEDLLVLDRSAWVNRADLVHEQVAGMLIEIRYNNGKLLANNVALEARQGPAHRLRLAATSAYLSRPALASAINTDDVLRYWDRGTAYNNALHSLGRFSPRGEQFTHLREFTTEVISIGAEVQTALFALTSLGPLAAI